jgi:hypothetical protein
MATIVYTVSAITSLACAALLLRGYLRSRQRLLLWSSLCFLGLAANNLILFVDKLVITDTDLSSLRAWSGFVAVVVLLYGLVTEAR